MRLWWLRYALIAVALVAIARDPVGSAHLVRSWAEAGWAFATAL